MTTSPFNWREELQKAIKKIVESFSATIVTKESAKENVVNIFNVVEKALSEQKQRIVKEVADAQRIIYEAEMKKQKKELEMRYKEDGYWDGAKHAESSFQERLKAQRKELLEKILEGESEVKITHGDRMTGFDAIETKNIVPTSHIKKVLS